MAGFRFRFQSILQHRQRIEDECQRNLAQLMRSRMIFHDQLQKMQDTIRESKQQMADSLVGKVDLSQVAGFAGYSHQVANRGQQLVSRLAQVEHEISEARQRLLDASRQRKALDRLREKHHNQWRRDQDRREAAVLDELATQRYARAMAAGGTR